MVTPSSFDHVHVIQFQSGDQGLPKNVCLPEVQTSSSNLHGPFTSPRRLNLWVYVPTQEPGLGGTLPPPGLGRCSVGPSSVSD